MKVEMKCTIAAGEIFTTEELVRNCENRKCWVNLWKLNVETIIRWKKGQQQQQTREIDSKQLSGFNNDSVLVFLPDLTENSFFTTRKLKTLQQNMKSCNQKLAIKCESREQIIKSDTTGLVSPLLTPAKQEPYKCPKCEKTFSTNAFKNRHLQTHNKNRSYECTFCASQFKDKSVLKSHVKIIHSGKKPNQFSFCQKSYESKQNLFHHVRRAHTKEKLYVCSFCGKEFAASVDLNTHIRSHTGEKPYKCSLCPKYFAHCYNLKKHIMTDHTGEKPFKCTYCEKSFSARSNMASHIARKHTKIKNHICSMCHRTFYSFAELRLHLATHTGDKPYKCDVCLKKFANFTRLKIHNNVHTHSITYKCGFCEFSTYDPTVLRTHNMRQHNVKEKSHCCSMCHKRFHVTYHDTFCSIYGKNHSNVMNAVIDFFPATIYKNIYAPFTKRKNRSGV